MTRIPALIVSGFLGSGKTTLVGHLLDQARAARVRLAIVSNEFGDTGIDRALLDAGEEGFVELDGGCVCCRLSDALGATVVNVIERAKPDRLVLETSGLAVPGEVVLQFWRPPIDALVSEVLVVVVVDGERFAAGDEDELMVEQIEAADVLLLNKCDRMDASEQQRVEDRLKELSHGQPVIRTVHASVDAAVLFPETAGERPRPEAGEDHHPHEHVQFDSFVTRFEGEVLESDVIARIAAYEPVRAKGFVRTADGVRVVQGVGPRIEVSVPRVPVPEHLIGTVVVIRRVGSA